MKISSKVIGVLVIVFIFGGIGISKMLGVWKTESTKTPKKYTSGEFAGQYNPEDIRGSYTFGDINNSFDIPVSELAKAFGIRDIDDVSSFKVKDLELIYDTLKNSGVEIGTGSVKAFVTLYKGLPLEINEEDINLPTAAIEILDDLGKLSDEQKKYFEKHSIDISNIPKEDVIIINEDGHNEEEFLVKGKTTFKEIIDFGISEEYIKELIGGEIPSLSVTIRDYCSENGIEFSNVKLQLQEKINDFKD